MTTAKRSPRKAAVKKTAVRSRAKKPKTNAELVEASRERLLDQGGRRLNSIWLTPEAAQALEVLQAEGLPAGEAPKPTSGRGRKARKDAGKPVTTIICELLIKEANRKR